jgi:hypothetical protein
VRGCSRGGSTTARGAPSSRTASRRGSWARRSGRGAGGSSDRLAQDEERGPAIHRAEPRPADAAVRARVVPEVPGVARLVRGQGKPARRAILRQLAPPAAASRQRALLRVHQRNLRPECRADLAPPTPTRRERRLLKDCGRERATGNVHGAAAHSARSHARATRAQPQAARERGRGSPPQPSRTLPDAQPSAPSRRELAERATASHDSFIALRSTAATGSHYVPHLSSRSTPHRHAPTR